MVQATFRAGAVKLGVVSDIHCQPDALGLALEAMGPVDRLICAGDAIDQSRFCERTVAMLCEHGFAAIIGNHEHYFFTGACRDGKREESALHRWLRERPRELRFSAGARDVRVVHATSWDDSFDYVTPAHASFGRFGECSADIVIYGHTHQPVVRRINGTLVVNPGSVGEGRPDVTGFVRSCAVVDCVALEAWIIDLD